MIRGIRLIPIKVAIIPIPIGTRVDKPELIAETIGATSSLVMVKSIKSPFSELIEKLEESIKNKNHKQTR